MSKAIENAPEQPLRSEFKHGLLVFKFAESNMRIEACMNAKLIFCIFGFIVGIPLIIAVSLAAAFSEWEFLIIAVFPLLIAPLLFLEIREKITIDSFGVKTQGVVWPRPCELSWSEIDKVDIRPFGVFQMLVSFVRKNEKGKEKTKAIIPVSPEVIHVVKHYYPTFDEQFAAREAEAMEAQKKFKLTKKVGRKGRMLGIIFMIFGLFSLSILQVLVDEVWVNATNNNTVEITATIERIERGPTQIYIDKHVAPLGLYRDTISNTDIVDALSVGDQITFRVLKNDKSLLDEADVVVVVYLRVGATEVVTIRQYNAFAKQRRKDCWLLWGSISAGLGISAAVLMLRSTRKKENLYKKIKNNETLNTGVE